MGINEWWPALNETTKDWLVAHNGEPLPPDVVNQVVAAGRSESSEPHLSDEEIDWIEAEANEE